MGQTIQFRRGSESNLPELLPGEPAVTLDTKKIFIGGPNGNIELPSPAKLDELDTQLAQNAKYAMGDSRAYLIKSLQDLQKSSGKVTFVGDSITENGWFHNITDSDYFSGIVTVNKGIGGNTTTDVIARLADIKATAPNLFVLAIGVNDARKNSLGAENATDYTSNMQTIVNDLKTVAPVVVIGIWRTFWKDQFADNGTYKTRLIVNEWNNALEKWCKDNSIHFINPNPMLDRIIDFANINTFVSDGVHPNDVGEKIYLDSVLYGNKKRNEYSVTPHFNATHFYKLDIFATNDTAGGYAILRWLFPTPAVVAGEYYVATSNSGYTDLATLFSASLPADTFLGVGNKANEFPLTIVFGTNGKLNVLDYMYKLSGTSVPRSIRSFELYETKNPDVFISPYHEGWQLIKQEGIERAATDTKLYDRVNKINFLKVSGCNTTFTSTYTKMLFPTTDISKGLVWDGTNSRFVANTEGVFNIRGRFYLDSATLAVADGDRVLIDVYRNGTSYARIFDNTVGANSKMINVDYNIYLSQDQYIEMFANTPKAGGLQFLSNNAFTDLIITKVQ